MRERMRVFATCNIGDEALNRLRDRAYDLEVYDSFEPPPKELILEKVRSGIDGLITTLRDSIDHDVFRAGKGRLRVVAQDAVGFDNIDRKAANENRIPFTNTADVLTDATAEFAFFMLGAVSRKLYSSELIVRQHEWSTWHPFLPILGDEVTGKTVTIIGMGRIGKALAVKCTGFEMDILCCDEVKDEAFVRGVQEIFDRKYALGLNSRQCQIGYLSFDEGLARGDYVSIHVPFIPETRHLINEQALKKMKRTAYLINTSRGPVVNEQALYVALKEEWIKGAALDVFEEEPLPSESPLRDPAIVDRLRLYHHFASATRETRLSPDPAVGMAGRCVQGLIDVLEENYGGDPKRMPYVVNKEAF